MLCRSSNEAETRPDLWNYDGPATVTSWPSPRFESVDELMSQGETSHWLLGHLAGWARTRLKSWRPRRRAGDRVIVWDSTLKTMTWHDLPNKWLTCCDTHPGGFKKWGLPRLTFLVLIFLWHASWRRRRTLRDTANVASVRVKWNPKKIVTITVLIIHHCMWVQPKRIESKNYMKLL